jgi:hypothetical protein
MARETRQLRAMRPAPVRGVGEMSDQEADLLGAPRTPEEFEDRAQVADVRAAWLAALIRRSWPSHSGHGSGLARAAIVCRLREPRSLTGTSGFGLSLSAARFIPVCPSAAAGCAAWTTLVRAYPAAALDPLSLSCAER